MHDEEKVRAAANLVSSVLDDFQGGSANPIAFGKIRAAVSSIYNATDDTYISEKTGALLEDAELYYYSERKHLRFGGPEKVRSRLIADIHIILNWLHSRKNIQNHT